MKLYSLVKRVDNIIIAPLTLALLFLMMLSGYAIICPELVSRSTFNLIGFYNAYILHKIIGLPLWILAVIHCVINTRPKLLRILGKLIGEIVNIMVALILIVIVLYLDLICVKTP